MFAQQVEEEWAHLKDGPATLIEEEVRRIEGRFTRPAYAELCPRVRTPSSMLAADRASPTGRRNVHPHKVPGYAAVTLSLKSTGAPPGDASAEQMDAIADLAERFVWRNARLARTEPDPRRRARVRSARAVGGRSRQARPGHAQHRPADQHHRLPRRRLLLAGQRQVDPGGRGDPAALRRPGLPARHRRARPQHFGLHEFLRPSPHRPHRHSRRGQAGRGVLPDSPSAARRARTPRWAR